LAVRKLDYNLPPAEKEWYEELKKDAFRRLQVHHYIPW
jgi:hypothetical protein